MGAGKVAAFIHLIRRSTAPKLPDLTAFLDEATVRPIPKERNMVE
jgi:hypothetical protein